MNFQTSFPDTPMGCTSSVRLPGRPTPTRKGERCRHISGICQPQTTQQRKRSAKRWGAPLPPFGSGKDDPGESRNTRPIAGGTDIGSGGNRGTTGDMTQTTLEEYRAHLVRRGASARTVRNYVGVVEQLQRWGGVPVEDLDAGHAAAFLHRPGLSQATRNGYHRWLTAYAAWSGSPLLEGVPRPRAPRPEPRPAARAQVDMMLGACRTDQETALVLLGCVAGLRAMEIARFRGEQLDPFERTVLVREGKGGKTARVPAPPALLAHARRMPARGAWFPSRGRPSVPVTPWVVWRRMTDISHRAGAGHVPPHRLRAAYATEMVRNGVPLTTVQKCMRHSHLATTAYYVAVGDDELHAAAASLPWSGSQAA